MQEQNAATTQITPEEVKGNAKNFSELRAIAEAAKQENIALKQQMSKLEEKISKQQATEKVAEDEDGEPYVDSRTFKKKMASFEEALEQKIDKRAEEKARALIQEERKADYLKRNGDFNEIMQADVLQKFIVEHPNVAEVMQKMPDNFERQQLVYETIKTLKNLKPAQSSAPPVQKSMLAQAFDAKKAQLAYQPGGSSGGPFQSIGDFSEGGMKNAYEKFKSLQKTVNL